jgi:hypothetical protein
MVCNMHILLNAGIKITVVSHFLYCVPMLVPPHVLFWVHSCVSIYIGSDIVSLHRG